MEAFVVIDELHSRLATQAICGICIAYIQVPVEQVFLYTSPEPHQALILLPAVARLNST